MSQLDEITEILVNLKAKKSELLLDEKNRMALLKEEYLERVEKVEKLMGRAKFFELRANSTRVNISEYENIGKDIKLCVEKVQEQVKFIKLIKDEVDKKIRDIDKQYQEYECQLQALEEQEKIAKQTIKEQPPEIQPLPPPKKEKIIQAPPNAFSLARSQAASTPALTWSYARKLCTRVN